MAQDLNARDVTINYDGGSLTMSVGNAKDLFGEDSNLYGADGQPKTVSVKSHSRVRVIGSPATSVSAYTSEFIQWPSSGRGNAAGGTPVIMSWTGSEGEWQGRVTGPLWKLGTFLQSNSPKSVFFHAAGGRNYGPFQKI